MSADLHNPGGKHRWPILPDMEGEAFFSADGKRRTILARRIKGADWTPFALWIGMNPSTAEGDIDDPTVRREVAFTRDRLNLRAYIKTNVMDFRTTDPVGLRGVDYPCSPENHRAIRGYAKDAAIIIAAWGSLPPRQRVHATATMAILREVGKPVVCLGLTKDGSPRHPLYVGGDAPFIPFNVGGGNG